MPIGSIPTQPASGSINAAYRPVIITANASGTPPVVYCDIYFNGSYYKSLSLTQGDGSQYQFDIQDAAQEFLGTYILPNGGVNIVSASNAFVSCQCKLRDSSIDVNGFIVPEPTIPVQATGNTGATAGGGLASNTFYILNSTIQHEQNQDLAEHLNAYKSGTWAATAYPLTHRPQNYSVCENDSDYFPIFYTGSVDCVAVAYTMNEGTTGGVSDCGSFPSCPVVSGISIAEVNNGNGTQTFTFIWGTPSPLLTGITIQYRIDGSGSAFSNSAGSTASGRTLTLPLGLYEFQFQMNGACNSSTSSSFPGEGIPAAACVPVGLVGSPSLPDGYSGVGYSYSFLLSGDQPFDFGAISVPAWITDMTIIGNQVNIIGSPEIADEGAGQAFDFDLTNACGTVNFADTMDVTSLARTLTFRAVVAGTFSTMQAIFNAPVDVDVNIFSMFADGYTDAGCGVSPTASMQAHDRFIPAGGTSITGSEFPNGDWSTINSFTVYNCIVEIDGQAGVPVFPGNIITMGSYTVTILFDGC